LEEHVACYQKLETTGYSKTLVITCNTKLCHTAQDQNLNFQNYSRICYVFDTDVHTGCIAQRYVVAIMGFLAVANAYTMRICLSTAITEMVFHHDRNESHLGPDACPALSENIDKPAEVSRFVCMHHLTE
jgi:hypothetical protein